MTFSRVEPRLPYIFFHRHHTTLECLSDLACSFVTGWLQLQDVLYGHCF